jgi:peptidoglycan-associated lipoprotein
VEYNLALGERRAKAVKNYLVSLGLNSKRMTIISYGEEKPVATGDSEEAYAKNRRANFVPLAQ